jgi:hypothetical protein
MLYKVGYQIIPAGTDKQQDRHDCEATDCGNFDKRSTQTYTPSATTTTLTESGTVTSTTTDSTVTGKIEPSMDRDRLSMPYIKEAPTDRSDYGFFLNRNLQYDVYLL